MRVAFVYGGQGSQLPGMGKDLYENYELAKNIYDNINLDIDVKSLSFEADMETISKTSITQPVLVSFNTVVTKLLEQSNIKPSITAGLSIGEYSALAAAGAISDKDVIEISRLRGLAMENATMGVNTSMFALLKTPYEEIEKACQKFSKRLENKYVEIANKNCPGQTVISGDSELVDEAVNYLNKACGTKAIKLKVSGAFHTTYMEPASKEMREFLKKYSILKPSVDVVTNVTGKKLNFDTDIPENLVKQVMSTVNFEDTLKTIMENSDVILEIGNNKTISGFVKKIDRSFKVLEVNNVESLRSVSKELVGAAW